MNRHNHRGLRGGISLLRTKLGLAASAAILLIGAAAPLIAQSAVQALPANWNVNGNYRVDFVYGGSHNPYDLALSGQIGNSFNVTGNYPSGGPYTYGWTGNGTVSGNSVTMSVNYVLGAVGTHMDMSGTIAANGTMSGSWTDNYGGSRNGTWSTTSGAAAQSIATIVKVNPSNTQGWSTADTRPGGAVSFVTDSTAPAGNGALKLTTDSTNAAKAQYMHSANTPLSQVTNLSYYSKQNSASFSDGAPSYQLALLLDGTPTSFTTLVYEPYNNGATITAGTWQSWDAASGQFWSSKTTGSGACSVTAGGGGAPFYTVAALKSACPSAVVVGFGVDIGTYNPSYDVETDLVQFNDTSYDFEPTLQPTKAKDCRNSGWQSFNAPAFANQRACENWVNARVHGTMHMKSPSQQLKIHAANTAAGQWWHHNRNNTIEYWNYDYLEAGKALHYTANTICQNIDPASKSARVLFQIPAGHPGLSGLYVVIQVAEGGKHHPDSYAQQVAPDLATGTQWCQTGVGYSPTSYAVTKSNLDIDD